MKGKRIILFDMSEVKAEDLSKHGVYQIINTINGHFYIGSTVRNFKERFKEHCRYYERYTQGSHPKWHVILWSAYDKYNIKNFKVNILEFLETKSEEEILAREEFYINLLNPQYNISRTPTSGGSPNLGRKFSEEWKQHIAEKSKLYKHSEETLKVVTENNKANAVKLEFRKENEILNFNSWAEAANYFHILSANLQTIYTKKGQYKEYIITKFNTQKKKIRVYLDNEEKVFESFNECDRYLNMWRGYTSTQVVRKKPLLLNKYKYEVI